MEFLERVVREHCGPDLLGDLQDERVATTDGAGRRCHELTGEQSGLILRSLGLIDAVREGGIDDDGDGVDRVLLHEGGDGVIELTQARGGAALGGDVGAIDDHMGSDHGGLVLFRWGNRSIPVWGWIARILRRGSEPGGGSVLDVTAAGRVHASLTVVSLR